MKFIKESIELKGIEESVEECIHSIQEEKNKISKRWGHTWYFDRLGNVEKVKAKDGTVLHRGERFQSDKDFYVINGFDPDTDTVFVVEPDDYDSHDVEGGIDYAVEDIAEIFKALNQDLNEDCEEEYVTVTLPKDALNDLPDFPQQLYWYTNRYALDFKTSDHSSYYTVTGEKEDIDRFIDDFDLNYALKEQKEPIKEDAEKSIFKITVREKDSPDIFSSFMVKANSEEEANQLYQDKYADYGELAGIRGVDDYEVGEFKRRGMKLYEDLEVDELEAEEEKTEDNPEPPVAGEESAAASIINSLIRDEWLAIEQYNSAMVNLKELKVDDKIIEVLNHVMFDENTHVGNLQEVLALLAPATDKIEKGNEQAEKILGTENEDVGV